MKISRKGLAIFQKNDKIYETFKCENFITHLYIHYWLIKTTLLLFYNNYD